jgi:hypothetical protein
MMSARGGVVRRRVLLVLLSAGVAVVLVPAGAVARSHHHRHLVHGARGSTKITVCPSHCSFTSIQAAIDSPSTPDGATIYVASGSYTGFAFPDTSTLTTVTVLGGGAGQTTISGSSTVPAVQVKSGTVTLGDVTIDGLVLNRGSVGLKDSAGTAIQNLAGAVLTMKDSTITGPGTGILNFPHSSTLPGGKVTLNDSTITGNQRGIANEGTLTLNDSTVTDNTADGGNGGGIFNSVGGRATLNDSTVSFNSTGDGDGGGIENAAGATLTLNDSTVTGNSTADGGGGGIANAGATVTLANDSTITGNTANDSDNDGDTADGEGGGVFNRSTLTLASGSTITGNTASGGPNSGGGIYNDALFGGTLNNAVAGINVFNNNPDDIFNS